MGKTPNSFLIVDPFPKRFCIHYHLSYGVRDLHRHHALGFLDAFRGIPEIHQGMKPDIQIGSFWSKEGK